jgi:hypothetical protein
MFRIWAEAIFDWCDKNGATPYIYRNDRFEFECDIVLDSHKITVPPGNTVKSKIGRGYMKADEYRQYLWQGIGKLFAEEKRQQTKEFTGVDPQIGRCA